MAVDYKGFIVKLKEANPGVDVFRRKDLLTFANENGYPDKVVWNVIKNVQQIGRGKYNISGNVIPMVQPTSGDENEDGISDEVASENLIGAVPVGEFGGAYVPKKDKTYVKWGHYKDIETIISSGMFYPVYVTGMSGNGKTIMVEQACASLKREYVRLQITPETDEDDLIGGFRLVNGETAFAKGPVIRAMEAGAILLIDEIDRGSNKLMAIQGVLEGKPVLIKKTGEIVHAKKGFNIIATSNTKGKGSIDGKYIAASIIDEAFLERFAITIDQPYATAQVEKRIVMKHMQGFGTVDEDFAEKLVTWAAAIRKTFEEGGVDEIVSTRRLCHIAQTFNIFKDRKKSVTLCVSRFDDDTQAAFVDLYTSIDATPVKAPSTTAQTNGSPDNYRNTSPF